MKGIRDTIRSVCVGAFNLKSLEMELETRQRKKRGEGAGKTGIKPAPVPRSTYAACDTISFPIETSIFTKALTGKAMYGLISH